MERAEAEGGLPDSVARPLDRELCRARAAAGAGAHEDAGDAPGMTAFFFVPAH